MEFSIAYEQQELIRMVRRFIDAELKPLEDEVEESGFLKEEDAKRIFDKSFALGLYAMNVPEELGGAGLSAVETKSGKELRCH